MPGENDGSNGFDLFGFVHRVMPWCIINTPAFAASAVTLQGETWTPPMTPVVRLIGPEFMKGLEQATGGW